MCLGQRPTPVKPEVQLIGHVAKVGGVVPVQAPDKPAVVYARPRLEDLDVVDLIHLQGRNAGNRGRAGSSRRRCHVWCRCRGGEGDRDIKGTHRPVVTVDDRVVGVYRYRERDVLISRSRVGTGVDAVLPARLVAEHQVKIIRKISEIDRDGPGHGDVEHINDVVSDLRKGDATVYVIVIGEGSVVTAPGVVEADNDRGFECFAYRGGSWYRRRCGINESPVPPPPDHATPPPGVAGAGPEVAAPPDEVLGGHVRLLVKAVAVHLGPGSKTAVILPNLGARIVAASAEGVARPGV